MVKTVGFKLSMSNCSLCCKPVELENPIFDDENANSNSNGNYDRGRFNTNIGSLCHDILEYDSDDQSGIRKLERKLSFCSNCSNMISAVVKKNQDAQNVGRKVEILQRRILREMKSLQGKMLGVDAEMKKIQDVVRNSEAMEMKTENSGEPEVEIRDFRKRILSANQGPQEYISSVDSTVERESKTQRIGIDTPTAGDRLTLKTPENDTSCKKIKPQIVDVHDHDEDDINIKMKDQKETHQRVFKCLLCAAAFVTFDQLREHLEKCDAKISCHSYNDKTLYLKQKNKIIRPRGNHSSKKRSELKSSLKRSNTLRSDGRNFNIENQLGRHQHDSHGNRNDVKVFECLFCKKHCSLKSNLKVHLLTHIEEKPYQCRHQNCSNSFATKGNLKLHHLTHSNERPFSCGQCQQRFKSLGQLRRHKMRHQIGKFRRRDNYRSHCNRNVKVFDCLFCKKHFSLKTNLELHLLNHIGEKPYQCRRQNCSKSYTSKWGLKAHQRTHSNEKPFSCGQCQLRYKWLSNLRQHGRRLGHEIGNFRRLKVKKPTFQPSICEFCGKRFQSLDGFSRHIRAHLGEKPYKCGYPGCNQEFVDTYHRNKHRLENRH